VADLVIGQEDVRRHEHLWQRMYRTLALGVAPNEEVADELLVEDGEWLRGARAGPA
jgi:hypothetical protein